MSVDRVVFHCGNSQLDASNRTFTRAGKTFNLEPKVFAVLTHLVMHAGELLTRDQLLDAVWGHRYVTPSTLNRVIALARRALEDDADEPTFIRTVHGSGYRYVGTVEEVISKKMDPRACFGPPASARLPARLQTLIGREYELSQIDALLRNGRSLTILGTGGMGKTQCALAFAHEHADRFPDGVWFFDLAPKRRAEDWLQALALALSIAPSATSTLLDEISQSLADRNALLLLDNCDRLSVSVGALIVEILRRTERLTILATSQQHLRFVSERVLRMPPLQLPTISQPFDEVDLRHIAEAPAAALLLARIKDSQPEFELTQGNAPAIVGVCERLDGMPLALELAAPRFALLSPDQVLERLDHRFRFLVSDVAGRDHRHRNLIELLEWGYALLSADEQRLLAWVGVFVQGWTVEAVIHFSLAFGSPPDVVVDLLTGLADKSLATVDQSISPPRYRLLESVREFALEKLKAIGEEPRARDAHLAYMVQMAEAAHQAMRGPRKRERIGMLMYEHGNIDSASEYALGRANDTQAALRLAGLLTLYFKAHGEAVFAKRLCDRALAAKSPSRTRERALALMCRGVNETFGPKVAAEHFLREAVSIAREFRDEWTAAYSSGYLALWLIHIGRETEAGEHVMTVERSAEKSNDEILRGLAGCARGWLYLAEDNIEEALAVLRSVRDRGSDYHQHHFIDMYIGLALFRLGHYEAAASQWHEAMRNGIAVGHLRGVAGSVEGCAYVAERRGKLKEACRFLGAAEQIRKRAESPLFCFWIRHNEAVHAALRSSLGTPQYEAAVGDGISMRAEDVVNEAAGLLRQMAGALTRP
jgi:predicted ATPase/DNA-binding winged helix-turn-helix (wHTH) protein